MVRFLDDARNHQLHVEVASFLLDCVEASGIIFLKKQCHEHLRTVDL